ncbi:MAG: hypothetical protein WDM90_12385 [Ferruginibacter sp.]
MVGVFAGSYPALLMSSFSPIESLKGKLKLGKGGAFFRKTLVVFQFAISVLLIISVTVVTNQMHYVQNADLGFDKEQSMIVKIDNNPIYEHKEQFKNSIKADPAVSSVALMTGEPAAFMMVMDLKQKENQEINYCLIPNLPILNMPKHWVLK